jgi:hypothetical protein
MCLSKAGFECVHIYVVFLHWSVLLYALVGFLLLEVYMYCCHYAFERCINLFIAAVHIICACYAAYNQN